MWREFKHCFVVAGEMVRTLIHILAIKPARTQSVLSTSVKDKK
jgi:hypothetical protein